MNKKLKNYRKESLALLQINKLINKSTAGLDFCRQRDEKLTQWEQPINYSKRKREKVSA